MEKIERQEKKVIEESSSPKKNPLETEKVGKLLRMFAIPCVLALVIQALYNIVDQIFIGNAGYLPFGNTATGIVYPLTVIAFSLGMWLGDGIAACMSLNQGRNKTEDSHKSVGSGLTFGLIVSAILVLVSFLARTPILQFFGASGSGSIFLPDAVEYSTFIIIGFPFYILGSIMNSIIRSDGSPRFAMASMVIGALVNVVLDAIFILACHMGMMGAALATLIGQVVTFAISFIYLFRTKTFKLTLKSFIPNFKLLFTSLKFGISSFLTQFAIVIIAVVNNIILMKYFVPTVENAQGILNVAFKIFGIVISCAIGVGVGGQPIIGYNYGAKKFDRVKQAFKLVCLVTLIVGVVATVLFETCPKLFLAMFGFGSDANELDFGVKCFRIYLGFILLTCFVKVISIFFQSIGMPLKAMTVALLRDVIIIVPLAILLPMVSLDLFFWSAPISDVLTSVVCVVLVIIVMKKLSSASNQERVKSEGEAVYARHGILQSVPGPIVTISREHGAGGREIGQKLAKAMGVPFYDKEIVAIAAEESGLAEEFVESVQDKSSALQGLYLCTEASVDAVAAQGKVLKKIAANGSCVIVGRAADVVLEEFNPVKVFVHAAMEYKIQRVMKNYGDDENLARKNVIKSDKHRAKFYNFVTGKEFGDAKHFNLCLDGSVGVENAVNAILDFLNVDSAKSEMQKTKSQKSAQKEKQSVKTAKSQKSKTNSEKENTSK